MATYTLWQPKNPVAVSRECFDALTYVSGRSRWSKDLERRLMKADGIDGFDWQSVFRGEEDDELRKHGIMPKHGPNDVVNPWPGTSQCVRTLLTTLLAEGQLTYEIQGHLLSIDRNIRSLQEENIKIGDEFVISLLGEKYAHFAPYLKFTKPE